MAATIARAIGEDSSRTKEATRLGSRSATGEANTWRTFASVTTRADGSGYVEVKRDGVVIHRAEWDPECAPVEPGPFVLRAMGGREIFRTRDSFPVVQNMAPARVTTPAGEER